MVKNREEIFSGSLLRLKRLEGKYECVEHPGAVAILPLLEAERVLMVRQFRPAVGREILELPAGLLEPGEESIMTGRRELLEETGYTAGVMELVQQFYTSPGYSNEMITLYVARGLKKKEEPREQGLQTVIMDKKEIKKGVLKGEFPDAKTLLGLQFFLLEGRI